MTSCREIPVSSVDREIVSVAATQMYYHLHLSFDSFVFVVQVIVIVSEKIGYS